MQAGRQSEGEGGKEGGGKEGGRGGEPRTGKFLLSFFNQNLPKTNGRILINEGKKKLDLPIHLEWKYYLFTSQRTDSFICCFLFYKGVCMSSVCLYI